MVVAVRSSRSKGQGSALYGHKRPLHPAEQHRAQVNFAVGDGQAQGCLLYTSQQFLIVDDAVGLDDVGDAVDRIALLQCKGVAGQLTVQGGDVYKRQPLARLNTREK